MICFRCNSEDFRVEPNAEIEQEFRGERLLVHCPAMMCTMCGWICLETSQADELRRLTADAYRVKHNLLASYDIRWFRRELGMNQRSFAKLLGVGEASVKRWETWLIQNRGHDELIRTKWRQLLGGPT